MDKKPRKDSKLDTMPESRVMELRDKLLANEGYKEILDWLALECGVSSTLSALSAFYKRHCAPLREDQRKLAAVKAEAIIDGSGRTDWNSATMELVKQVSFEIMSGQQVDTKTAEKFIKLILKADAQDVDKRKLAMLEEKSSSAKAALEAATAKAKAGGGISEETLKELEEAAKLL
jgi:hypothetical protein